MYSLEREPDTALDTYLAKQLQVNVVKCCQSLRPVDRFCRLSFIRSTVELSLRGQRSTRLSLNRISRLTTRTALVFHTFERTLKGKKDQVIK